MWRLRRLVACPPRTLLRLLGRPLVLLLVLLCAPGGPARAEAAASLAEPRFESVGQGGALAHGVVSALAQDRAGFIWIGTGAGLMRYDGHSFRPQLLARPGQPTRPLGFVRSLLAGREGRLWIGTESDGLALLDPATEQLRLYSSRPEVADSISPGTIRALAEERDGTLWVGTVGHGLDRLDPVSGRVQHFRAGPTSGALDDNRIQALLVDRRGDLWVGSWRGLSRRAAGSDRFEPQGGLPTLAGQIITSLFEDREGQIWVGTQRGDLLLLDPASGRSRVLQEGGPGSAGSVYSFVEALPGQVWVGRGGGIELRRAGDGGLLQRIRHQPRQPAGLASNEVRALLLDRGGWVWAGSYGGGLQRHNPANTSIWVRRESAGQGGVFEEANARSLLQLDNGDIWVGTAERGVAVMDAQLRLRDGLPPVSGPAHGLPGGRVGALAQARDGTVWLGCDTGLFQLDRQRRVLRQVQAGQGRVRRLLAAADGRLWIATQDGLYRWAEGRISRLAVQGDGLLSGDVNALAEDGRGVLWVGSERGLYRLEPGAEALLPVQAGAGDGLAHHSVVGLLVDSRQQLWVDTAAGLHRLRGWDGRQATFERVSERHGVAGRAFGANLLEDGRGRIWTQQFLYDPAKDSLYELTAADGVDMGTGWFRSYTRLADGRLLFGGSQGLLVVTPDGFDGWHYQPPLVVSELRIDGRPRSAGLLSEGLRLQPGERSFSLEFAALDYSDPARSLYAYRLEGFDADWIRAPAAYRVASYGNLSPGRYMLQVRATNRSGAWSPHELAIPVQVLPAWWQRWWARGLALLATLALFWGLLQLRTAYLRRRRRALELMVRERTQELESLSAALQESSLSDPLTGLRNRRFLAQHIEADVALALRHHASPDRADAPRPAEADLIFFLIDIDHFKQLNDDRGHAAGDAVLRQMRARLQAVFRESDHLVRWGGEEFLIVARATSRSHAAELAERARRRVAEQPFVLDDGTSVVQTCSVGFACFPLSPAHPQALDWGATVGLADAALYAAKNAGRNTWVGVLGLTEPGRAPQPRPSAAWLDSGELRLVRPAAPD